jgi:hypothetical protein
MSTPDYDALLANYRQSVDRWVDAIRHEESLATGDLQLQTFEQLEDAAVLTSGAGDAARKARDEYTDALRKKNFNF